MNPGSCGPGTRIGCVYSGLCNYSHAWTALGCSLAVGISACWVGRGSWSRAVGVAGVSGRLIKEMREKFHCGLRDVHAWRDGMGWRSISRMGVLVLVRDV